MIYVELKGRMCNQMFQIATAKALSLENNDSFICSYNTSGIKPTTNQTKKYRKTVFKKLRFESFNTSQKVIDRGSDDFSYKKINYVNNLCLTGYYQSEKYFIDKQEEIREMFSCPPEILAFIERNYKKLLQRDNSCAVHIRRGDYLKYKEYHNNLNLDYYKACFDKMKGKHFVFFSDDIQWCKKNFKTLESTFVDSGSDIIDFYLMSNLKNHIIANSSYSWWAAWLNKREHKTVLAPRRWFGQKNSDFVTKDLIPSSWEIIDG